MNSYLQLIGNRIFSFGLVALMLASHPLHADEATFDDDGNWIGDVQTYARHCGEVVGAQIPDFSCERDGVPIPITVNGLRATNPAPDRCDRPAFNTSSEDACRVGSRLGRLSFDDADIEGVFICRRSAHPGPSGRLYEEIAVLLHNQRNGATCGTIAFGRGANSSPLSGDVKSPATSASANADGAGAWQNPNQFVCGSCHRPDPFLFTPYVEQVRTNDGARVMPGFYDGPDGLNPRLWYPLSPLSGLIQPDRAVFAEGSPARIRTSCHALGAPQPGIARGSVPLLEESLGRGGAFLDNEGRQTRRATNPGHAWMHIGHPVIRPPFALEPAELTGFTGLGFVNALGACANENSSDCSREPFRGRPLKAIEFSPSFTLSTIAPGVVHNVAARQRNHDLGDLLRLSIRQANGRTRILKRLAAFDEAVSFTAECEPGDTVSLKAELVRNDGSAVVSGGRAVSSERRLTCVAPNLTRWLPSTRTLEAAPDMTVSGALVGPRVAFPVAGFSVGDRNNGEAQRVFLSFPIKPPVSDARPVKATLSVPLEAGNGNVAPLGGLFVTHYRYGSELTAADFSDPNHVRRGRARLDKSTGPQQVDVTDLVRAAWDAGDDRLQIGIWFQTLTDGDRSFDTLQIQNKPRGDGEGQINFNAFTQPRLSVTFQ